MGNGCIRDVMPLDVKLKEDSGFKCQTCSNQQTDIPDDSPGTELNGQSSEIVE